MKEIEKILGLGKDYKVEGYEEKVIDKITYKVFKISCKKIKDKCPSCGKYTKSVHDKLKPMELKCLKCISVENNVSEYSVRNILQKNEWTSEI